MYVSVIMCTYNRAELLGSAIESILAQSPATPCYELIVVDNNSSDGTRAVVERYLGETRCTVRYLFEVQQGLSYARNAGIAAASADIVAFTDDDVIVAADWVAVIEASFAAHPEIDCLGGKVLPRWAALPPPWLTRDHWSPLALVDRGEQPMEASDSLRLCFVGANLAVRKSVFEQVGLFAPRLQRVKNGIGSTEDHEFLLRIYATGRRGRYIPELIVTAEVQSERLTRAYHRRWHTGHGHFCAVMQLIKPVPGVATMFGVPSYFFRGLLSDIVKAATSRLRLDDTGAFVHENAVRWGINYFKTARNLAMQEGTSSSREIARFFRDFLVSKLRRHRV